MSGLGDSGLLWRRDGTVVWIAEASQSIWRLTEPRVPCKGLEEVVEGEGRVRRLVFLRGSDYVIYSHRLAPAAGV